MTFHSRMGALLAASLGSLATAFAGTSKAVDELSRVITPAEAERLRMRGQRQRAENAKLRKVRSEVEEHNFQIAERRRQKLKLQGKHRLASRVR